MEELKLANFNRLPHEAKYWFTGIHVNNSKKHISADLCLVSDGSVDSLIWYKDGRLNINIKQIETIIPPKLLNT